MGCVRVDLSPNLSLKNWYEENVALPCSFLPAVVDHSFLFGEKNSNFLRHDAERSVSNP